MKQLQPIEYQDQRILTTLQLAEAYETDVNNINKNFSNNKDRFTAGKHYFFLEGEALKQFKFSLPDKLSGSRAPSLYLWTEKGAWLHAKSLNTDRAWEAYEMLVDEYYRILRQEPAPALSTSTFQYTVHLDVTNPKELKRAKQALSYLEKASDILAGKEKVLTPISNRSHRTRYIADYSLRENVLYYVKDLAERIEAPTIRDLSRYITNVEPEKLEQEVLELTKQGLLDEDRSGKSPRYRLT